MQLIRWVRMLYARGAFHILVSTFANKFVVFFGTIVVVRLLSREDYGLVSYVENIYGYVLIFAGLGLSNGLLRFIVLAEGALKRAYFRYILRASLVRNLVLAGVLLGGNAVAPYPPEFEVAREWVPVMALLLPLQDLVKDGRFGLRAVFENKTYANLTMGVSVALIVGRVAGAYLDGAGGVLWSRVIVNGAFAGGTVWMAWRAVERASGERPEPGERLSRGQRREVDAYSAQYMITNGLWALFMLNDTFLLGQLGGGAEELADYRVALVVPGLLALLSNAIGMFLAPYFTKHEQDAAWVWRYWRTALGVTAVLTGIAAGALAFGAEEMVTLFYGEGYRSIVPLMQVLLFAQFIYSGLGYTTVNILSAMGQVRANIRISIAGMVLQAALDVWLIPLHGAMGVAMASCLTYTVMCVLVTGVFARRYRRG